MEHEEKESDNDTLVEEDKKIEAVSLANFSSGSKPVSVGIKVGQEIDERIEVKISLSAGIKDLYQATKEALVLPDDKFKLFFCGGVLERNGSSTLIDCGIGKSSLLPCIIPINKGEKYLFVRKNGEEGPFHFILISEKATAKDLCLHVKKKLGIEDSFYLQDFYGNITNDEDSSNVPSLGTILLVKPLIKPLNLQEEGIVHHPSFAF